MPWDCEITGYSDNLGYVRCSEHAESSQREHPLHADHNPAYVCDYPECGRRVGGERSPDRVQVAWGHTSPDRWACQEPPFGGLLVEVVDIEHTTH